MKLDIVIPVFNEQDSLRRLVSEIQSASSEGLEPTIVFVDDGSTDDSWQVIADLSTHQKNVSGIRLARNYGKSVALQAGFERCQAEFVFTMDADLQDDPKELARFIEKLDAGADFVCGWKKVRRDGVKRWFLSKGFNCLVNLLTGMRIHDHNCGYKVFRRSCLENVRMGAGMHRFLTVMVAASGKRVEEIVVNHRPRAFGKSKYGATRIFHGLVDLVKVVAGTRFGKRPICLDKNAWANSDVVDRVGEVAE